MRVGLTVAAGAGTGERDVLVELEPGTRVADLTAELARATGRPAAGLWLDGALLPADADVALTPLAEGAVVALDQPAAPEPPAGSGLELRVVAGPDAGQVVPLRALETVLGRSSGPCRLADREVSRRHAAVRLQSGGAVVEDLGSTNGTLLEDEPVHGPVPLPLGARLQVGESVLLLARTTAPDTAVSPDEDLTLRYNRPPRLVPPAPEDRVTLPEEPREAEGRSFPLLLLLVPLALSGVVALVLGPRYLLLGLLSPVMLLAGWASDRSSGRGRERRARERYDADVAAAHARLERLRQAEEARRREEHPDPAAVLLTALGPRRRLWERRRDDADALDLRVGTAELPARVALVHPRSTDEPPPPPVVRAVPVVLPLRALGVVGLAGPTGATRALARWCVGQLAALHSPRDLSLVLLTDRAAGGDWGWFRWLPHARPAEAGDLVALVGNDPVTAGARAAELAALVKARRAAVQEDSRRGPSSFPAVVVVLDGARGLRRLPAVASVLADGPAVGVHALCLDAEERLLPEECRATVVALPDEPARVRVRRAGSHDLERVLVDHVAREWAGRLARALAPLRDAGAAEEDEGLPSGVRLLPLLGADPPDPDDLAARWSGSPRSATAVLGAGTGGPVEVRFDRTFHGLVAGTTGSGKSELLQTVVASLALANRPDEMTFLLVDYKGGSAFAECASLPHTVGMVTDLDGHLVQRALASLDAEFDRRQQLLREAAVEAGVARIADIDGYSELRSEGRLARPLPRLLIVVDEFAAMVAELPDFVPQLVDLAARGRSVGMHLLLATQSPSGVVSPKIAANLQFRVALRVADAAESTAVLEDPSAARIPRSAPGRGYLRLGPGHLTPFQAARVGGRRPGRAAPATVRPWAAPLDWRDVGQPAPRRPAVEAPRGRETDLGDLVAAVTAAAERLAVPRPPSPWLPPLPDRLPLAAVLPEDAPVTDAVGALPFGLLDLPAEQRQVPAVLDLTADGPLFVVGAAQSGRTQVLRTLAAAVAQRHTCADVHLYALDCGGGVLLPLARLPHCGAVVLRSEPERAARLLARLTAEVARRQALLSAAGFASVAEQRAAVPPEQRLPHVLLLVDRWEAFTTGLGEVDGGALLDAVMELLREGASAGVHLVVTGDRSLASGRVSTTTDHKIGLRLGDRADWSYLGLNPRQLPETIAPGRAFRAESGAELQVALLADDPAGRAQADALLTRAAAAAERDRDVPRAARPFRVDVLPPSIGYEQARDLPAQPTGAGWALVGVGGDDLEALGLDLGSGAAVVAGPARSGRSTALLTLARSLRERGTRLVVAAPRPSPLRDLAGADGVVAVLTGPDLAPDALQEALAVDGPVALLVDDGEALRDCSARDVLRALVRGELGPGRSLVLGGSSDEVCSGLSGWQVDAKRARRGLLLSPQSIPDGDLVGLRLPRSAVGGPVVPGRGLLHRGDGRALAVQVPLTGPVPSSTGV